MQEENNGHFWKNGLSIYESRISVLIITLIATISVLLYSYISNGDISNNLLELTKVLIYAVVGINLAHDLTNSVDRWREKEVEIMNKKKGETNNE